jgi:hypothetical protein
MVAVVRPNDPGGLSSADLTSGLVPCGGNVRELQRTLWACAKRSPERRFHALCDRIWRSDVLREAWRRVRANRGAAGVDAVTLAEIEEYGVERLLGELQSALPEGRYRPAPVRRVGTPKSDGGVWPLGIPTARSLATSLVISEQRRSKVKHGNVADARHPGHILDADLFVTEDRVFDGALQRVVGRLTTAASPQFSERSADLISGLSAAVSAPTSGTSKSPMGDASRRRERHVRGWT